MCGEGSVVTRTHAPLARTTPQSLATLQSHAGAAEYSGSLSEKHTLCTAGPHQPRPEGTTLKDTENWGRELPSFPLLGQAEGGRGKKRESFHRVCVSVAGEMCC